MAELNLESGRTVRVFVPPDVANKLQSMQSVTAEIMKRLGCAACHSGRFLLFEQLEQREAPAFYVNARGEVHDLGALSRE